MRSLSRVTSLVQLAVCMPVYAHPCGVGGSFAHVGLL